MKAKILSKLTIAQLACLPLISISCGKHEQKAKENLVAVASSPKFDKLINKNKENKTDKVAPIVEKIEVVNNGKSESKQIEKDKKVEIKNPNNPNSQINVEVKNDIKINNKINTKGSKLKTFFAVIGGLATAAAVGYGIYWLFKDDKFYTIQEETTNNQNTNYSSSNYKVKVTIQYKRNSNTNNDSFENKIKTFGSYLITKLTQQWTNTPQNNNLTGKITIEGSEWIISQLINKFKSKITNYKEENIKNYQKLLKWFKSLIN